MTRRPTGRCWRTSTTPFMEMSSTPRAQSTGWLDWRMGAGSSSSAWHRRIALPLAEKGLDVWGVDGSPDMLTILKEKPGGDKVTTLCGDFATTAAEGKFDLVVLLINTIYAMGSQQGQIECFENAARHLAPGGRFVIATWVPDPPRGDALGLKARRLGRGFAGLVIEDHDAGRAAAIDHADRYRRNRCARGPFPLCIATRGRANWTSWLA